MHRAFGILNHADSLCKPPLLVFEIFDLQCNDRRRDFARELGPLAADFQ
jgi:hypothetical protein